jgi:hypothetical protein
MELGTDLIYKMKLKELDWVFYPSKLDFRTYDPYGNGYVQQTDMEIAVLAEDMDASMVRDIMELKEATYLLKSTCERFKARLLCTRCREIKQEIYHGTPHVVCVLEYENITREVVI